MPPPLEQFPLSNSPPVGQGGGRYPQRQKNVMACLRGTRLLSRAVGWIRAGREPRATRIYSGDTQLQMRPLFSCLAG